MNVKKKKEGEGGGGRTEFIKNSRMV